MNALARDVMQTDVLVIKESATLLEAQQFFVRHEISGAPVVDDFDRQVGVVSIRDLMRDLDEEFDPSRSAPDFFLEPAAYGSPDWAMEIDEERERLSRATVADVMTTETIAVRPDAPVGEVAQLILKHRIHRVLVIDPAKEGRDEIAGLISLFDLVRLLQ